MAEAAAFQLAVADLHDALDAQRLPVQVLAGVPAALHAGAAVGVLGSQGGGGPLGPGVALDGVLPQRGQRVDALAAAEGENWVWQGADCDPSGVRCRVSLSNGGLDASTDREFDVAERNLG